MTTRLKFGRGNAKTKKWNRLHHIAMFSLPAGFTCPGALLCLSKSNRETGRLTDGPKTQFRCYAASAENLFSNIRKGRWNNFEKLRVCGGTVAMADLIERSLPRKSTLVRLHQSGDYYSQDYFDAWLLVAQRHPEIIFYGYTKALPFWIARLSAIPDNLRLVASYGGRFDHLIEPHKLRTVTVVFSEAQAKSKGLTLDDDDSLVWQSKDSFAILLHGTQPIGSEAGKAWQVIKTKGKGGYKSDYFAHYAKSGKMSARFKAQVKFKKQRRKEREREKEKELYGHHNTRMRIVTGIRPRSVGTLAQKT
jgi:hypothetical protein